VYAHDCLNNRSILAPQMSVQVSHTHQEHEIDLPTSSSSFVDHVDIGYVPDNLQSSHNVQIELKDVHYPCTKLPIYVFIGHPPPSIDFFEKVLTNQNQQQPMTLLTDSSSTSTSTSTPKQVNLYGMEGWIVNETRALLMVLKQFQDLEIKDLRVYLKSPSSEHISNLKISKFSSEHFRIEFTPTETGHYHGSIFIQESFYCPIDHFFVHTKDHQQSSSRQEEDVSTTSSVHQLKLKGLTPFIQDQNCSALVIPIGFKPYPIHLHEITFTFKSPTNEIIPLQIEPVNENILGEFQLNFHPKECGSHQLFVKIRNFKEMLLKLSVDKK